MESVLGVAAAGSVANTLYDYNRTSWNTDVLARQVHRGQRQGIKISEISLLREDVRDTIQPAMQKQQNQILVITLILGIVAGCLTDVGVPAHAAWYLKSLYQLCIGSSLLYLVLALTFALAANYLASICQREMLTKMVRLPVADFEDELRQAEKTESVEAFEHQDLKTIFRVPGLSRARRHFRSSDSDSDSNSDSNSVRSDCDEGPYNRGQAWRERYAHRFAKKRAAFEFLTTCASICGFLGVGNLLHALSYMAFSRFFFFDGSQWSSWTVAVQCVIVQAMMAVGFNSSFSNSRWHVTAYVEAAAVVIGHAANCIDMMDGKPHQLLMTVTFMSHLLVCFMIFFRLSQLSNGSAKEGEAVAPRSDNMVDSGSLIPNNGARRKAMVVGSGPRRALHACIFGNSVVTALWLLSLWIALKHLGV